MSEEFTEAIKELSMLLKASAASNPPNWVRSLKAYSNFDWSKINATKISEDKHGATKVVWCEHVYTRRAGENKKFGAAIWFSRAIGKTDDETSYAKLITFKDSAEAEPLPDYVVQRLGKSNGGTSDRSYSPPQSAPAPKAERAIEDAQLSDEQWKEFTEAATRAGFTQKGFRYFLSSRKLESRVDIKTGIYANLLAEVRKPDIAILCNGACDRAQKKEATW